MNEQLPEPVTEPAEVVSNPTDNESFAEVLTRRLARRDFLKGAAATLN